MQRGFLYNLGCCDTEAFVDYNFAPPSLRRAIGLLGFLHKRVLGLCHPALLQVFPYATSYLQARYHSRSLDCHMETVRHFPALYDNSIWTYALIYNRLPQELIDSSTVSIFQGKLTQLGKMRAQRDDPDWREAFQSCEDTMKFFHGNPR